MPCLLRAFADKNNKEVPRGTVAPGIFLLQKPIKRLPCLHEQTFDGRKNMEHEVRNVLQGIE